MSPLTEADIAVLLLTVAAAAVVYVLANWIAG